MTTLAGQPEGPALQALWPVERAGEEFGADAVESALLPLYAYPDHGLWLRANMVATLDGAATGDDGRTGSVNTPVDRQVFHALRGLADAVLVGAGTVRAESYGPIPPPGPVLAVVTRSGGVPQRLLDDGRTLVVTTEATAAGELESRVAADRLVVAGATDVDLPAAIDTLRDKGFERLLCEGGPSLLADLVAAGRLDELCLTWSPLLTGDTSPRILSGSAVRQRFRLGHLLHFDGTLLGRWVAAR